MKLLGNSARGHWRLQVWFTTCSDVCASHWSAERLSSNMEEKRGAPTVTAPSGHTNRKNKVKSLLCFGMQKLANSSFVAHRPWSVSLQLTGIDQWKSDFHVPRDSKTQKKAGKHHVVNSNSCELQKRCFKLHVVKVEVKGRMKRSGCCSERLHHTRPLTVRKPRQASVFPWIHQWDNGIMG